MRFRIKPGLMTRDKAGNAPAPVADGKMCFRASAIDKQSINEEERTVEFTASSDVELERWPGVIEVLSHKTSAVDLSRLKAGAQLLFNHCPDDYLGVIESARVVDRKIRVKVRFSENEDAEKVWKDVKAGILRNVSIGYRIWEVKLTEEREGVDVYTVIRWEPYEVSIVTIPADITVGIGRDVRAMFSKPNNSNSPESKAMNRAQIIAMLRNLKVQFDENATDDQLVELLQRSAVPAPPPPAQPAPAQRSVQATHEPPPVDGAAAERDRMRSILAAGRQYNAQELAQKALEDGKTVEEFRTMLIEHIDKRNKAVVEGTKPIGLTEKEARSFSFVKLLRVLSSPEPAEKERHSKNAEFELEACRAAADKLVHRSAKGMVIPTDVLLQPLQGQRADTIIGAKTAAGYTNAGTNNIQTLLLTASFIDMLRMQSPILQLVTELSGLVGNIDIPKQLTGSSATWIGEDEAAPKSDITFGIVSLRPKTVSNRAEITRRLLLQDSLGVEALVRSDLAKSLALEITRAALYGTNANNQPKGLSKFTINAGYWATTNKPTYAELVEMETAIANDEALMGALAYICTSNLRGHFKTTRKFTDGLDGVIWEPGNTLNGYRAEVTNQLVSGDVFFGNWADLLVGMWGGLDITVDPYTHSDVGRIRITQFQDLDFTVRREESFALYRNLANS